MRIASICLSLLMALSAWGAGHKELPAKGDLTLTVFDKENVRFVPDVYGGYALLQKPMELSIW